MQGGIQRLELRGQIGDFLGQHIIAVGVGILPGNQDDFPIQGSQGPRRLVRLGDHLRIAAQAGFQTNGIVPFLQIEPIGLVAAQIGGLPFVAEAEGQRLCLPEGELAVDIQAAIDRPATGAVLPVAHLQSVPAAARDGYRPGSVLAGLRPAAAPERVNLEENGIAGRHLRPAAIHIEADDRAGAYVGVLRLYLSGEAAGFRRTGVFLPVSGIGDRVGNVIKPESAHRHRAGGEGQRQPVLPGGQRKEERPVHTGGIRHRVRRPVLPDHRGGTNIVAAVILGGHSLLILLGQQQAVRLREGEPPAKPQGAFHLADNPVQRPVRNLQTIKARPPRRRRKGDRAPVRKAYRRFAGAVGLIGDIPRSLQRSGVKVGGRQKDLLDRLLRTGLLGQVGGVIVRPGRC